MPANFWKPWLKKVRFWYIFRIFRSSFISRSLGQVQGHRSKKRSKSHKATFFCNEHGAVSLNERSPKPLNAKRPFFVQNRTLLQESLVQSFFAWKPSATKLQDIHWPIYPCENDWFYVKIWRILTHPLQNADFQFIFARSASVVTPSK